MDSQPTRRSGADGNVPALKAAGGLVVALVLPLALTVYLPLALPGDAGTIVGLIGLWLLAAIVVLLTIRVERRGWAGIGVKPSRPAALLVAVLLGIGLMLLVPLLSFLASWVLPTTGGDVASVAARPWPVVLVAVVTAAVTEEVLFRAYPIERLAALTRSPWPGAVLGLIAFVLLHAGNWNPAHVVGVVLPLGLLLTLIYVWRRNLLIVIIAHLITDIPLVMMAIAAHN
jgi:membrane protease YdiL (CAAX protease family)